MKPLNLQWLVLMAGLTAGISSPGSAQGVTGRAYGVYASTPVGSTGQAPLAVLPTVAGSDGDMAHAESDGLSVGTALSAEFLNSMTSGALGRNGNPSAAGTQSVASLGNVNILGGLIRATGVIANVASTRTTGSATSDANGSSFSDLVVAGVPVTAGEGSVAPNTRITLPNVGYVILNEQQRTGDGVTSSAITVNMIHVVMQEPILGVLGQVLGYRTVGNIIVGSASSGVQ